MNRVPHLLFVALCLTNYSQAQDELPVSTFKVPSVGGWVVTPDTETLIISVPTQAQIVFFDTVGLKNACTLDVEFQPTSLALQEQTLFVAAKGSTHIHAIELGSGKTVRRYSVTGEPVRSLACHPSTGPVFASGTDETIHLLDPKSDRVTKTKATGQFLQVDPAKGTFLLTGTNRPPRDVVELARGSSGRLQLEYVTVAPTAFVQKYVISGNSLKLSASNPNAAVGAGGFLGISQDGKRYAMVAGGGWWSLQDPKTKFGIAVFETDDMTTMQGGLDVGGPQVIAFHPVLNIGVGQGANYDFFVFDTKSLVIREKRTVKPNGPVNFWHNLLAFTGRGTRIATLQGEHLHLIPLNLTAEQERQLTKAFGKLPDLRVALEKPTEEGSPAPVTKAKSEQPKVTTKTADAPTKKNAATKPEQPKGTAKSGSAAGQKVSKKVDHVVELANGIQATLTSTASGTPFLSDRPYALSGVPKALKDGSMLVRDSGAFRNWLSDGQVVAKKPCRIYVAIHLENTGQQFVSQQAVDALENAGWTIERDFRTTAPDKESWKWALVSREIPQGPIKVPAPSSLRTNLIFLFR